MFVMIKKTFKDTISVFEKKYKWTNKLTWAVKLSGDRLFYHFLFVYFFYHLSIVYVYRFYESNTSG